MGIVQIIGKCSGRSPTGARIAHDLSLRQRGQRPATASQVEFSDECLPFFDNLSYTLVLEILNHHRFDGIGQFEAEDAPVEIQFGV